VARARQHHRPSPVRRLAGPSVVRDAVDGRQECRVTTWSRRAVVSRDRTLSDSVPPIQLARCRFPWLTISNARIKIYLSNKICGSSFEQLYSSASDREKKQTKNNIQQQHNNNNDRLTAFDPGQPE